MRGSQTSSARRTRSISRGWPPDAAGWPDGRGTPASKTVWRRVPLLRESGGRTPWQIARRRAQWRGRLPHSPASKPVPRAIFSTTWCPRRRSPELGAGRGCSALRAPRRRSGMRDASGSPGAERRAPVPDQQRMARGPATSGAGRRRAAWRKSTRGTRPFDRYRPPEARSSRPSAPRPRQRPCRHALGARGLAKSAMVRARRCRPGANARGARAVQGTADSLATLPDFRGDRRAEAQLPRLSRYMGFPKAIERDRSCAVGSKGESRPAPSARAVTRTPGDVPRHGASGRTLNPRDALASEGVADRFGLTIVPQRGQDDYLATYPRLRPSRLGWEPPKRPNAPGGAGRIGAAQRGSS